MIFTVTITRDRNYEMQKMRKKASDFRATVGATVLGSHGPDLWSLCPKSQCGENRSRKAGHQGREERNHCPKHDMRKENRPKEGVYTISQAAVFTGTGQQRPAPELYSEWLMRCLSAQI